LVPFVTDGLDAGEPVMVAVIEEHGEWLRESLGAKADDVKFFDMADLGRNPAKIIPAWQKFLDTDAGGDGPARGVGEPIWAGRGADELIECQVHEALLNVAVDPTVPFWLVCPYDVTGLEPAVIDEAYRSHPVVIEATPTGAAPPTPAGRTWRRCSARSCPSWSANRPPSPFNRRNLGRLRAFLKLEGHVAGLGLRQAADLATVTSGLAADSLERGATSGRSGSGAAAVGGLRGGRRHPPGRSAGRPTRPAGGRARTRSGPPTSSATWSSCGPHRPARPSGFTLTADRSGR
jgi:hypothetical protein